MSNETFRDNLHRLADAQGLDFDGLARAMGYIRDDKKWLRRLWQDGLGKPDERRDDHLQKLTNFLGLDRAEQLWTPDVQITPSSMKRRNTDEFVMMAMKTYWFVHAVSHLYVRCPKEMDEILSRYGMNESKMIGFFVANTYNVHFPDHEYIEQDRKRLQELYQQHEDAITMETTGWVIDRARKTLEALPEWMEMENQLERVFYGDDVSEFGANTDTVEEIDARLQDAIEQPLSEDEIVERFKAKFLGTKPALIVRQNDILQILDELRLHPNWPMFLDKMFEGDDSAAVLFIRKQWRETVEKSSDRIDPSLFVSVFKDHYFHFPSGD